MYLISLRTTALGSGGFQRRVGPVDIAPGRVLGDRRPVLCVLLGELLPMSGR